jgi:hypothetical protein
MPLRWHVNLPGPVAYSRPMRKSRKKSGPLTALVVWFIVKPLELMFRGMAKLFTVRSRSNTGQPAPVYTPVGWYNTVHGPLYFNGSNWYAQDGRPMF